MRPRFLFLLYMVLGCLLAGCQHEAPAKVEFQMGERVPTGPLTYNVIDSSWRPQLGDALTLRVPQHRFLLLTLSVTNSGRDDVSIPLFSIENESGQSFTELDKGDGIDNWFGLLRTVGPAQTQQGRIVFDAPLTSYKLRVTDGGEPGAEKFTYVAIPLRMDVDTDVVAPSISLPGH